MVKQEQGETLRKYIRRFFDKRATVVDVTDKEVIDLFQDGLEGPIRRTREGGGSEWEPIKILLEGDGNSNKMNTTSNTRL
jgi:hypothetical protein